jgi:hypothetical protein
MHKQVGWPNRNLTNPIWGGHPCQNVFCSRTDTYTYTFRFLDNFKIQVNAIVQNNLNTTQLFAFYSLLFYLFTFGTLHWNSMVYITTSHALYKVNSARRWNRPIPFTPHQIQSYGMYTFRYWSNSIRFCDEANTTSVNGSAVGSLNLSST